ncbi:MAG: 5'/3'-nucleotidase SurE [Chitinivibrionales bacterium]|nr:5'/3'-nucleotidase SurE [Chitinivibrionales bacterium]
MNKTRKKPFRMLLTNDDGFGTVGITSLYGALKDTFSVTIAAPASEQSGVSHAFTFSSPLYYSKIQSNNGGLSGYAIRGTPSDCVKFAVSHLLGGKPDIVVSGMNIGENSGTSGFYSGTVAAAREGAFWQIPSFAFSTGEKGKEHVDDYSKKAVEILEFILEHYSEILAKEKNRIFFNVNFPECPLSECRGVKITRQSMAFFDDRYRRVCDKEGKDAFYIYGEKRNVELSDDYDSRAVMNNYIAITPLDFDATSQGGLNTLAVLEKNFNIL